LDRDLFDAKAHGVDVIPSRLEPDHDLVHEQRKSWAQLAEATCTVNSRPRFAPGSVRAAIRFTDDLPPLLAIDAVPA
jgi:hypothetical protein